MQYSPKLKKAMQQIEAILKENDIAGFVVLHTPGHSEFLNHVTTSYSCAKIQPDGIHLKLNSSEIGIQKATQIATDTLNMVTHIAKHTGECALFYMSAEDKLNKLLGGRNDGNGTMTSHIEQNN